MTTDIDTRIRELSVRADLAEGTLVLMVDVDGSEEELYRAITDPEVLRRWSPVVPEKPLSEVGPNTARENPDDDPVDAEVIDVAPGAAVGHRWGEMELHWSVEPGRVNLQTSLPDPSMAASLAAGWQICLAVLDAQLSGEYPEQPRIVGEDALAHGYQELHDHWAGELGQSALSEQAEPQA